MELQQAWVAHTYLGLADLLESADNSAWVSPSLCTDWQVRHVVAHVTMAARLSPAQFGVEIAAANGDFAVLSNTVAERDSSLPHADLLAALRSATLHQWQPPGGGVVGAINHSVIHSLDITVALDRPAVAPQEAIVAVLDQLVEADGTLFGIDLNNTHLESIDTDWQWGADSTTTKVRADSAQLVALLSGRTLPDGRSLSRR